MKRHLILFAAFVLILVSAPSFPVQDSAPITAGSESETAQTKPDTWRNFENLFHTINQAEQDLEAMRKQLREARSDAERERIRSEMDLLASNIDSLQLAWEMWATGGIDLQLFSPKQEEKFDWRQEMQSAFEPMVMELRRLTERPRKMERLRSEQSFYQQRLAATDAALKNIADYKSGAPTPELANAFGGLETRWHKRRDEMHSQMALINLQLEELSAPNRPTEERATEALKELLSGRFVNLLLAVLAAALTYGVLHMVNRFYARLVVSRGRRRPFLARVAHLSFMLISAVLALLAGMAVLYARGDWILLGLLLIVLMGAALTLQRTLPAYIKEAKVLLNLGPVREGERVIYAGLPWKVEALNMSSTLVNPALRGGRLALPASELGLLVSRRYDESEPWFPTREGDFVLLSDDTCGRVLLQTPEVVQLRVAGAVRTYPVAVFLSKTPQNLSANGFEMTLRFSVDNPHSSEAADEIAKKCEGSLARAIKETEIGAYLKDLLVDLDETAASFNFLVWASFSGEAAESYGRIPRLLRRLVLDACNANNWALTPGQIIVHPAGEERPSSFPAAPR